MASAAAVTADDTIEGAETESTGKAGGKKKLIIFIAAPLLLLSLAGAGLYFTGFFSGHNESSVEHKAEAPAGPSVYHDLPDLLVNLNVASKQARFLKISVSLELGSKEDVAAVQAAMPRVIDHFQTYLRELRLDDLRGSAGIYRLRQELLTRVTAAAHPVKVRDVLFRELLVQ